MDAGPDPPDRVAEGREALREGAWSHAREAFEDALRVEESPAAFEGYAQATRWLGKAATSLDARERAFRTYREAGDATGAARNATWLAYDHVAFRGDIAVAAGWFARAHRLLEDLNESEERGWLAFFEGEVALLSANDAVRAGELAALASEIGARRRILDLEMVGRSLEGLARVSAGEVAEGMALLDEASTAAVSGEFAGLHFAGNACCHLIYACERVQDVDRAAQWCDTVRGFCENWSIPQLFGFCRAHYAAVLILRGEWEEAERELAGAMDAFECGAPALEFEALLRLAELRRRQGRAEEAAELCDRMSWHPQAKLCLAELAMDRGEPRTAEDLLARYLRALPTGEKLARAPALALLVRVHAERGEGDLAASEADELAEIAASAGTDPLRASLQLSKGVVAIVRGDDEAAREAFEDAVDLWTRCGAPFEAARARAALGGALRALDRDEDAERELGAAVDQLEALGAEGERARTRALLEEVQQANAMEVAPGRAAHEVLSRRELEVLRLAAQGLTDPEIAERLVVSKHTVHRHMGNIRTKLNERSKAGAVARAAEQGLL
jgi:ATP/maltotriose-dependent transcriptional regulator MalT